MTLGYTVFAPVRVLDGVKSLSYAANMLATRLAQERGFDDALLLTPHGRVLELPTGAFFWIAGGAVRTPPLSDHILDSITRRIVIEVAGAEEVATAPADLESAEEAFVASSVWEVVAVRRIEEHDLRATGPVTAAIAGKVRAHIAAALADSGRSPTG
jgi:branched-chain amino acid aminotransferase